MLSRKKNPEHILDKGKGFLSCLPLKLIQMQKSALIRALVTGKEIVGRGRDHYPIAKDDQEYLDAIAVFNQSNGISTTEAGKHPGEKLGERNHLKSSTVYVPGNIPFISDSEDFVYVFTRRTVYLKLTRPNRKKKHVLKREPYHVHCSKHPNIDTEISQIVTF